MDPAYYTVANGDGQTTAPSETDVDVGSDARPATECGAPVLRARLNQIFEKADFDGYVEALCQRFYADEIGRPSLAPGRYFRLLLIGYFEGLDAERGSRGGQQIPLRCGSFSGCAARGAAGPFDDFADASLDRSRNARSRLHVGPAALAEAGLVKGKTIGIDATTWRPTRRCAAS